MNQQISTLFDVDIVFNCYEKTFAHVISEEFITDICRVNAFPFKNRIIVINNVKDRQAVAERAEKLVQKKVIQYYVFVDDYIEHALKCSGTTAKDWGRIFKYSSWALVMLYAAKSKYVVHWDEYMTLSEIKDWITPSLLEMERNRKIVVASPLWSVDLKKVKGESYDESKDFYYDHGFTDLVFLANRYRLLLPFYKYHHVYSSRYPLFFVSATFESRIDSYLRRYDLTRITYKHVYYKETNISPAMGAGYPKYSQKEKIYNFYFYWRLKFFNIIYDPVINRYRFKSELILKFIKENIIQIENLKTKFQKSLNRLKNTFK